MKEHRCEVCEATFYAEVDAWGGATCGDCIAAAIEMALVGLDRRKPSRRATPSSEQPPAVAEERRTA